MVDACLAPEKLLPPVIHISHPHPAKWLHMIDSIGDALKSRAHVGQSLTVVPFSEWNERVISQASVFEGPESERYKKYPTTKIQDIFDGFARADMALRDSANHGDVDAGGTVELDTSQAQELSQTLREAPILGREHADKWVSYWRKWALFT